MDLIQRKAFRPIKKIHLNTATFTFEIEFQDGVQVSQRDNVGLRLFFATVQYLSYEVIEEEDSSYCVSDTLNYFKVLGFRSGDKILFKRNQITFPILFS